MLNHVVSSSDLCGANRGLSTSEQSDDIVYSFSFSVQNVAMIVCHGVCIHNRRSLRSRRTSLLVAPDTVHSAKDSSRSTRSENAVPSSPERRPRAPRFPAHPHRRRPLLQRAP